MDALRTTFRDCAAAILGGGQGTRLYPLTAGRAKPAVPFGGKFRLIDVPLSNCINSGFQGIFILTQFSSASLHHHINRTYQFDNFRRGFVQILAAEQSHGGGDWYQGTADAVRQNLHRLLNTWGPNVIILSGDQLYRMNYAHMQWRHDRHGADLTIAVLPVERERVSEFGILRVDEIGRIVEFAEKPKDPKVIDSLELSPEALKKLGYESNEPRFLASMGIYIFKKSALEKALANPEQTDFGHEVIPSVIESLNVMAHLFEGYWEDIGTIRSFFDANIALTRPNPSFDLYDERAPIYTRPRYLPATRFNGNVYLEHCIVGEGAHVEDAEIRDSVIGVRSVIRRGTSIRNSILMGADFYNEPKELVEEVKYEIPMGIGRNCRIENAIIDKNARIGDGCVIVNERGVQHEDHDNYNIRDGIVIVPRKTQLNEGTVI